MATIKRRAGGTNSTILKRREYSTAFSPTSIAGCQLWLDGADPAANGVIPANGATVSTWNDKSGNGKNGAATGTPTYLTGGGINFNGSSYFLNQAFSQNLSQRSIIIVMQETTHTDFYGVLPFIPDPNSGNDSTTTNGLSIETKNGLRFYANSGGYTSDIGNTTLLVKAIYNDNMNVTTGSGYLNGTNATNVTANYTAGTCSGYGIGGRWLSGSMSGSYRLNGVIYEIIMFNTALSTNNRQTIESYLAQKWGLTGALPSGHSQFSQPAGKPNNINNPILGVFPVIKPSTFSPLSIPGSQLWLDAADTSSITFSSGSNVSQWRDKAVANNATANTAIVYNANGLGTGFPALTFTSSQWLDGSISITGSTMTVFSIFSMNSASPFAARVIALAATGVHDFNNTGYVGILRQSSTNMGPYRNGTYTQAVTPYSTRLMNTTYFDGTNQYTTTNGGTLSSNASAGSFTVSAYRIANNTNTSDTVAAALNGFIGEILVYNTSLTTAQRQQIEGYLAWKWGLQGNLPVGHPYYSAAP